MIVKQRAATGVEMDGDTGLVTVLTAVDRGLYCDRCGQDTRADHHVLAEEGGPVIITLTGCTTCRSGLYAR